MRLQSLVWGFFFLGRRREKLFFMNTRANRKAANLRRICTAVPRHLYERACLEAIRKGTSVQQIITDLLEQHTPDNVIVRKSARNNEARISE